MRIAGVDAIIVLGRVRGAALMVTAAVRMSVGVDASEAVVAFIMPALRTHMWDGVDDGARTRPDHEKEVFEASGARQS